MGRDEDELDGVRAVSRPHQRDFDGIWTVRTHALGGEGEIEGLATVRYRLGNPNGLRTRFVVVGGVEDLGSVFRLEKV